MPKQSEFTETRGVHPQQFRASFQLGFHHHFSRYASQPLKLNTCVQQNSSTKLANKMAAMQPSPLHPFFSLRSFLSESCLANLFLNSPCCGFSFGSKLQTQLTSHLSRLRNTHRRSWLLCSPQWEETRISTVPPLSLIHYVPWWVEVQVSAPAPPSLFIFLLLLIMTFIPTKRQSPLWEQQQKGSSRSMMFWFWMEPAHLLAVP